MSFARVLTVLPSWILALVLGLGPLGAEVLAALGHGQVCACCRASEVASCCGDESEAPASPQVVAASGCPCALLAPASAKSCPGLLRSTEAPAGARPRLERLHRSVELAWVALPTATGGESSPAPPGAGLGSTAGLPGADGQRGSGRASALGVLRL